MEVYGTVTLCFTITFLTIQIPNSTVINQQTQHHLDFLFCFCFVMCNFNLFKNIYYSIMFYCLCDKLTYPFPVHTYVFKFTKVTFNLSLALQNKANTYLNVSIYSKSRVTLSGHGYISPCLKGFLHTKPNKLKFNKTWRQCV